MKKRRVLFLFLLGMALLVSPWGIDRGQAQSAQSGVSFSGALNKDKLKKITLAERKAAAARFKQLYTAALLEGTTQATLAPGEIPHYFGPYPNYANSPMPMGSIAGVTITSPGSGYTAPTVSIVDLYTGEASAVAQVATLTATSGIESINVSNAGIGYAAPVVVITDTTGKGAAATATIGGPFSGGIKKFVDSLPGLGSGEANNLGQYIPIATPNTAAYGGSDYYEIALVEYREQMHSDLPAVNGLKTSPTATGGTKLRGYVQEINGAAVDNPHFLGPLIIAHRDRPVRIKFTNKLPTGSGGNLFIPVDTTVMGAGMGPSGSNYTQNRAAVHLHGNNTVWISDGTPHQWTTPATESTPYPKGVSVRNVPDMPEPGAGSMTIYYTNKQSARLMFYHDHAYGITRLNVYAGEAAGYLLTDQVEQDLINGTNLTGVNPSGLKVLPGNGVPLVIQDRTFVDPATIGFQDPTWNWGTGPRDGQGNIIEAVLGDLWFPHVYMPNQNPADAGGMNAFGRWHYGPWFWPPATGITYGPIPNPYYGLDPWEPPQIPATPNPSSPAEAFMDTPIVNGTAYPYLEVEPKAYRFRILNAANDRFLNLQLYEADPAGYVIPGTGFGTEVKMVPAVPTPGFPEGWPTDSRDGGVPDPATAGPLFIQIGTEGGFLPAPVEIPMQPVDWNMDQTNFDMGLVNKGTLILGTAERADVIVDFSAFAGKTIILYNDAPAPFPALDARYDYYTGSLDLTDIGGTPPTQPGYGPNTRTIMQFRVGNAVTTPTNDVTLANLEAVFAKGTGGSTKRGVFEVSQDEIIVPSDFYNSAYAGNFPADPYVRIFDFSKTFETVSQGPKTFPFEPKAIQDEMGEAFDTEYGRMSAMLGLELPGSAAGAQNFMLYPYVSPPVEIIKNTIFGTPLGATEDGTQFWKITHNGVDTHTIHTHLFNVQLINRVAWDDALRLPDPNELGWKETVRVNPLQDTIVAFRAVAPQYPADIPFKVPNSVRLIDPTKPDGAPLSPPLGGFKDPNGNPVPVLNNHYVNYGWEYVYHCHLLAHEEMDMMHSMGFAVAPDAPLNLAATLSKNQLQAILTWQDNAANETGYMVQRATDNGFTAGLVSWTLGNVTTYTDSTIAKNQKYYYRVAAVNTVGDITTSGFPVASLVSGFSNTAEVGQVQTQTPNPPSNLTAALSAGPQVTLNWKDNSNNEAGFQVERSTDGGVSFAPIGQAIPANTTTFADASVAPGNSYAYRVKAVNAAGSSAYSNTASISIPAIPAAPANFAATARKQGNGARVTLTWRDNSSNETGFEIQRANDAAFSTGLNSSTTPANATSAVQSVASSVSYYYRIRAVNQSGASAWVNAAPFPIVTP